MKKYSIEEVATHNSKGDLWIIVDNQVFDLSKFQNEHPGVSLRSKTSFHTICLLRNVFDSSSLLSDAPKEFLEITVIAYMGKTILLDKSE